MYPAAGKVRAVERPVSVRFGRVRVLPVILAALPTVNGPQSSMPAMALHPDD